MAKPKIKYVSLGFRGDATVKKKRVKQANGKVVSIHAVDAESPTFAWELSTIFAKNVAKARRANADLPFNPKTRTKLEREIAFRQAMTIVDGYESNLIKDPRKKNKKNKKRSKR